jgi:hypothetical protein
MLRAGDMTKQDHICRAWDTIEKTRVGMLTTRFAGDLRAPIANFFGIVRGG